MTTIYFTSLPFFPSNEELPATEANTEIEGRSPEILSSKSLDRKYYTEGLSVYEDSWVKEYSFYARLFLAAFDKGIWQSAFYLGQLYRKGRGVEKNDEKAFNCYLGGAAKGHGESCNQAGVCLEHGIGTEKNVAEAVLYFKRGYAAGTTYGRTMYGISLFLVRQYRRTLLVDLNYGLSQAKREKSEQMHN